MRKRILRTVLLTALAIVMVLGFSSAALAKFSDWTDMSIQVTAPYGITLQGVASISQGYPDNTWKPYQNITRAQFTKMVVQFFDIPLKNPATPSFTDVPAGSTFYPYIEAAKAAGAVNGKTATYFSANENITRQQAIAIISRYVVQQKKDFFQDYMDYFGDEGNCGFPWAPYKWNLNPFWTTANAAELIEETWADADAISPTFNKEMIFAKMEGITKGDIDNTIKPVDRMTRIQAAAIILRAGQANIEPDLRTTIRNKGPAERIWVTDGINAVNVCEPRDTNKEPHPKTNPFVWKWYWTAIATPGEIGTCEINVGVEAPKAGKAAKGKAIMAEVPDTDPQTYVVSEIEVTDGGEGYTAADAGQKLTVAPPPGFVPATAVARVSDNKVVGIDVTSYGSGYPKSDTETSFGMAEIDKPGSGTPATAEVFIQHGSVTRIEVDNPGTGYLTAPKVTLPTGGIIAEYTIGTITNGKIESFNQVKEGIGYGKTPPAVTVPAPIKKAAEAKAIAENGMITDIVFKKDKDGANLVGAGYMANETPKVIFPSPSGEGKELARAGAVVSGHQIGSFNIHDPGYGYYCEGKVAASTKLYVEVENRASKSMEGYRVEFELLGTPNTVTNGIYNPKAYLRDPAYDFNGDEAEATSRTFAFGYTLKTRPAEVVINLDVDKAAHLKGRGEGNIQNRINVKVYDPDGVLLWEQVVTLIWDASAFDNQGDDGNSGTTTTTTLPGEGEGGEGEGGDDSTTTTSTTEGGGPDPTAVG